METQLVDYPAVTVVTTRATCRHEELGPVIGQCFGKIGQSAEGLDQSGAPRVYYMEWLPDSCTIEAAIPVLGQPQVAGDVEFKTAPAGTALMASYFGPYTGLAEAWSLIWRAIEEGGYKATGTCWDEYVTDPGEEPDQAKWQTDLFVQVDIPKF